MTSKRRLREKQCGRKRRHRTQYGAAIERRMIRKNHGHQGQIGVYLCPFCGFWHVGHIPGRNGIGSGWR